MLRKNLKTTTEKMLQKVTLSVDLEPNKDGSLKGIQDAMEWFDRTVPCGTVYTTYDVAKEIPEIVLMLSADHEIGVHVHPREFGHKHDQLAELDKGRQYELIERTRDKVAEAADLKTEDVNSFRAGRHSANKETFEVLDDLGFIIDASINIRYTDYLPSYLTKKEKPFYLENGLLEIPTTFYRPPLFSRVGIRILPQRQLTATANTLRTDSRICTGKEAIQNLFSSVDDAVSMYMHPYDATDYHSSLENNGVQFRQRFVEVISELDESCCFVTASDLVNNTF